MLKSSAAIQKANLAELEQGRAGFGVQALSFFLGCRYSTDSAVET